MEEERRSPQRGWSPPRLDEPGPDGSPALDITYYDDPVETQVDRVKEYQERRRGPGEVTSQSPSRMLYVEVALENRVIGGLDLAANMALTEVRACLQESGIGIRELGASEYAFLPNNRASLTVAQEDMSVLSDLFVPNGGDDLYTISLQRIINRELPMDESTAQAANKFEKAVALMSIKSAWSKSRADVKILKLEKEARHLARVQKKSIEDIEATSRSEAELMRLQMQSDHDKMEAAHAKELLSLRERLEKEKMHIQSVLLAKGPVGNTSPPSPSPQGRAEYRTRQFEDVGQEDGGQEGREPGPSAKDGLALRHRRDKVKLQLLLEAEHIRVMKDPVQLALSEAAIHAYVVSGEADHHSLHFRRPGPREGEGKGTRRWHSMERLDRASEELGLELLHSYRSGGDAALGSYCRRLPALAAGGAILGGMPRVAP